MISYLKRAIKVITGGINGQRRQTDPLPPLCFVGSSGPRVRDSNGQEYIDFHCAFGATILGHSHPVHIERISTALQKIDLIGLGVTPGEVELAERLVEDVPCFEQVLLCNTGGEATMAAIRLARGVTGRPSVLKFWGSYHGAHDYVLANDLDPCLGGTPSTPDPFDGVLPAAREATLVSRYNDLDALDRVMEAHAGKIAAIIIEPYAHNIGGAAPLPGFLAGVRRAADKHGALLIFDEVITGVRHGKGGYQEICGVTPDIATLAKALGNGIPIAAIGGRRDLMEHFNTHPTGRVLYSGTFNGGPGPVAGALATLDLLAEPGAYDHLYAMGDRMRTGLRDVFAAHNVTANVSGIGSAFHLLIGSNDPVISNEDLARNDDKLYMEYRKQMMLNGVLETPETRALRSHITLSHNERHIDRAVETADVSLPAALKQLRR